MGMGFVAGRDPTKIRYDRRGMTIRSVFPCAALALALSACSQAPAAPPAPAALKNVLIVTIDTLRADRLGIYGAKNVATPNMDRARP